MHCIARAPHWGDDSLPNQSAHELARSSGLNPSASSFKISNMSPKCPRRPASNHQQPSISIGVEPEIPFRSACTDISTRPGSE
jgi:hypothetical protein